ncbi:MAG: hypothetical protein ABSE51_00295 [Terracidiphilus sp.]|jgi:hypothetical protein
MSFLAHAKSADSASYIARFETKIIAAQSAIAQLPGDDWYADLLAIINRPGWTSIAEGLFFEALIDTINDRAEELLDLHERLKAASLAVQRY